MISIGDQFSFQNDCSISFRCAVKEGKKEGYKRQYLHPILTPTVLPY